MSEPSFAIGIEEEYQLVDPESRELTSYITHIPEEGTSADRQVATYEETGDLKIVVDRLVEETAAGVVE